MRQSAERWARCEHCGALKGRSEQPLTHHQRAVYEFVAGMVDEKGFAPTLEEIRVRFQYRALSTVHEHLHNLEQKGWIKRSFNARRGIVPLVPLGTDEGLVWLTPAKVQARRT